MSLDLWSTLASLGTFIVIAATAIAAMLQLKHLRSGNKVLAMQTFFLMYEGPELREAFRFVRSDLSERLKDPDFRRELRLGALDRTRHPELQVANFFDQWGLYFRDGVIDRASFMRANANVVDDFWNRLEPVIALLADPEKGNTAFQQFEYLTIHARRWTAQHPDGDFPKGEARISLADPWREEDLRAKP